MLVEVAPLVLVDELQVVVVTCRPVWHSVTVELPVAVVLVLVLQTVPEVDVGGTPASSEASTMEVGCTAPPVDRFTFSMTPGLEVVAAVVRYPVWFTKTNPEVCPVSLIVLVVTSEELSRYGPTTYWSNAEAA